MCFQNRNPLESVSAQSRRRRHKNAIEIKEQYPTHVRLFSASLLGTLFIELWSLQAD